MRCFVLLFLLAIHLCAVAADPFFGMDAAMSWLTGGARASHRERLLYLLRDNGVSAVRERLMWKELHPRPESFQIPARYMEVRELCRQAGLKVLDLYHDAPPWNVRGKNPYPTDLPATRDAWRRMADRLQENWCGWEIWNEPDIGFGGNLPFDQYHVLLKTINLAAEGRSVPLVGMVSAAGVPGEFYRQARLVNAFELIDAVSFHSYNSALMLSEEIAAYQRAMGAACRPLWITESGFSFPVVSGKESAPAALHASAWHIALKTVVAKAAGVERIFPFVYSNYHEGVFSFSLLDPKLQPYPALLAYFTTIRMLREKTYVGDLPVAGAVRAPAFVGADGSLTAVVVSADPKKPLPDLPDADRICDLYGQAVSTPVGFAWLENPKLQPIRDTTMQAMAEWAEKARKNHRILASTLVIQPLLTVEQFAKIDSDGYQLGQSEETDYEIPVRVWNLGTKAQNVELTAEDNAGNRLTLNRKGPVSPDGYAEYSMHLPLNKWIGKRDELLLFLTASSGGEQDRTVLRFQRHRTERVPVPREAQSNPIRISEWHSMGGVRNGESDLDAEFLVGWKPRELTFRIDVTDDVHSQSYPPEQLWMGDSLQLAVRILPGEPKKTTQYTLGLPETGKPVCYVDRKLPGIDPGPLDFSTARQGKHTKYLVSLAPENLNAATFFPGMKLGVALFVNDNDGEGRKGGIAWGDGIARHNGNPAYYYEMILE